jgi:hypothetical protein
LLRSFVFLLPWLFRLIFAVSIYIVAAPEVMKGFQVT